MTDKQIAKATVKTAEKQYGDISINIRDADKYGISTGRKKAKYKPIWANRCLDCGNRVRVVKCGLKG